MTLGNCVIKKVKKLSTGMPGLKVSTDLMKYEPHSMNADADNLVCEPQKILRPFRNRSKSDTAL